MSLQFEFPEGHAYDFDMIVAGITAYLNQSPDLKNRDLAEWPIQHSDADIHAPATARAMCTTTQWVNWCSTVDGGGGVLPNCRVHVSRGHDKHRVTVIISNGYADPIHEMIGKWRYDSALAMPKHQMV